MHVALMLYESLITLDGRNPLLRRFECMKGSKSKKNNNNKNVVWRRKKKSQTIITVVKKYYTEN
jgi:hypothetical protein